MISNLLDFTIDLLALVLAFGVFLFNYFKRNENKSLVVTSFMVMLVFAGGHLFLGWLSQVSDHVAIRYQSRALFYIGAFSLIYVVHLSAPKIKKSPLVRDVLFIMLVGTALNILLDIDRNHFPLNKLNLIFSSSPVEPNYYDDGYWWLWSLYTYFIYFSDYVLISILALGEKWAAFRFHPSKIYKRIRL